MLRRREEAIMPKPTAKAKLTELFQLDDSSSIPIWLQLKNRFTYLITSGYYLPGDQLPTVRGLAAEIEINYNTVSKVYQSLEEDGLIVSKRRHGAFVCDVSDKPGVDVSVTAEIVTTEYLQRCQELGMSLEDVEARFAASMKQAKLKRDREARVAYAEDQKAGRGRIVEFNPVGEDGGKSASAGA